jgi:hypothetical protein
MGALIKRFSDDQIAADQLEQLRKFDPGATFV